MNYDEMRKNVEHQKRIVDEVLNSIVKANKCPCNWPQFDYWVGKEQGPGWQDGIQNDLVEAALKLQFFIRKPPAVPEYWLEADVHCAECGAGWKYFSEEWRMLAFQERLVLLDRKILIPSEYTGLTGAGIAATAGHEPEDGRATLPLAEWEKFMKGEPYLTEPYSRAYPRRSGS